jgi:hypothetical protein
MKTRMLFALLLPVLLAISVTPAQAQDVTPLQLKYIDAQLEIFIPSLAEFQAKYFDTNKAYYQALGSHDKAPATADVATDLKAKPSDQLMDLGPLWDAAGLPASLNWAFRVDVAVTPWGPGYTLVVQTTVKDAVWQRTITTVPGGKSENWYALPVVVEPDQP